MIIQQLTTTRLSAGVGCHHCFFTSIYMIPISCLITIFRILVYIEQLCPLQKTVALSTGLNAPFGLWLHLLTIYGITSDIP